MRLLRRLLTILAAIGLVFGIAVPAQAVDATFTLSPETGTTVYDETDWIGPLGLEAIAFVASTAESTTGIAPVFYIHRVPAGGTAMILVAAHHVRCDRDDRNARSRFDLANFFRGDNPVHHRQADIHEDGKELSWRKHLDGRGPIAREFGAIAKGQEHFPNEDAVDAIIFDDEHHAPGIPWCQMNIGLLGGIRSGMCHSLRQMERKRAASVQSGDHRNRASHGFSEALRDREPQPGTLKRAAQGRVPLRKGGEQDGERF